MTIDVNVIIDKMKRQIGDLSFQVVYLQAQVEMLQKQLEQQQQQNIVMQEVKPNDVQM